MFFERNWNKKADWKSGFQSLERLAPLKLASGRAYVCNDWAKFAIFYDKVKGLKIADFWISMAEKKKHFTTIQKSGRFKGVFELKKTI